MPKTKIATRDLDGYATSVLVQMFADRVLVLVTQLGKVGTLIQASIPDTAPLPPPPTPDPIDTTKISWPAPPAAIQLTPLFGSTPTEHIQTLHSLYTAQLATIIWSHSLVEDPRRSVVVGLALRKSDRAEAWEVTEHEGIVFQGVMTMLHDILVRV